MQSIPNYAKNSGKNRDGYKKVIKLILKWRSSEELDYQMPVGPLTIFKLNPFWLLI